MTENVSPGPDYKSIAEHCNLWRNFVDISNSWHSVLKTINFYGEDKGGQRVETGGRED